MASGFSPAQRFVLFQSLYQASQSGDNNWDQLVALLSKGQRAAQRAQLDSVAAQFADGQRVVMDELREGGVFLEWELQFLKLGLAVGDLAKMYLRLAEHYRLQAEFQQNFSRVGACWLARLIGESLVLRVYWVCCPLYWYMVY